MREAQIALHRASSVECAKKAKLPGGNASEWIAQMIAGASDIQKDKEENARRS